MPSFKRRVNRQQRRVRLLYQGASPALRNPHYRKGSEKTRGGYYTNREDMPKIEQLIRERYRRKFGRTMAEDGRDPQRHDADDFEIVDEVNSDEVHATQL